MTAFSSPAQDSLLSASHLPRVEIAFVDATLADLDAVLAGMRPGIEVVVLDHGSDGLAQIAAALAGRSNIDAIHLVGHGAPGSIALGATTLAAGTIDAHADSLARIGQALGADGDILLYGCDSAAGEGGASLLVGLASLSGADVAGSLDATGSSAHGGNWVLEAQAGVVESAICFGADFVASYGALLGSTYGHNVAIVDPWAVFARPGQEGSNWLNKGGIGRIDGAGGPGFELSFMVNSVHNPNEYANGLRGHFEYNSGDGVWRTVLIEYYDNSTLTSTNGGSKAPYDATVRYVDDRPGDATNVTSLVIVWNNGVQSLTSSAFTMQPDNAPTAVGVNTLDLWSGSGIGDQVATLTSSDTGITGNSLYSIDSQSIPGLFAVDGGKLVLASGTLAPGQSASVTLRFTDGFQRQADGAPIEGEGVMRTVTFTGRANPDGFNPAVHVNSTTANVQNSPSVAVGSDGGSLVTWRSVAQDADTGTNGGIYAQRYDAAGERVGAEFAISNPALDANDVTPQVVALANGRYAVAYTTAAATNDVVLRLVEADGSVGPVLQLQANTALAQSVPVLAALAGGGIAAAWVDAANGNDIRTRVFDANGAPLGADIVVHGASATAQQVPGIAALANGNYVVSWRDAANGGEVMARVMNGAGAVSADLAVATGAATQTNAKVAGLAGGGFVVVYQENGATEGGVTDSSSENNVYARLYNSDGVAQGARVLVNAGVVGSQVAPGVTALADGGFAVAWSSNADPYQNFDVFARRFGADGQARDDYDLLVNEGSRTANQNAASISASSTGFVVSWADAEGDGSGNQGVIMRSFSGAAAPTLGSIATLPGGVEDSVRAVTFANLIQSGDESDADGTVVAFVVKSVASGSLAIGASAQSATAWAVGSNDVIDATHHAYWTPARDANGSALAAFRVVARDNDGLSSSTPVAVKIDVAAVNDAPTLAHGLQLTPIDEDVPSLDRENVSDPDHNPPPNWGDNAYERLIESGYADPDLAQGVPLGIVIAADASNPLTEGRWQYSTDPATEFWHDVGPVSPQAALLLPAGFVSSVYLRFVPVADFAGVPGALTVHAVDDSGGGFTFSDWDGATERRVTIDTTGDGASSPVSASGVQWSVTVNAVNDAPEIAHFGSLDHQSVAAGDAAVALDIGAALTVGDVDSPAFGGGRLEVAITAGSAAGDVLAIRSQDGVTLSNGVHAGSTVSVGGVAIGTIGAGPALAVDFNDQATQARVTLLMRNITFDTSGGVAGARTVEMRLSDGAGGHAEPQSSVITVTTNPTVAISSDKALVNASGSATITFSFSDAPVGFDAGDISVTGGVLSGLAQDGLDPLLYRATFTPDAGVAAGSAAVSVAANSFVDAGGQPNLASTGNAQMAIDTVAPSVTISSSAAVLRAGQSAVLTFSFSEAPLDFSAADISSSGGVVSGFAATANPLVYSATFTPDSGANVLAASVGVDGAYVDAAGNPGSGASLAIGGDTRAPTVSDAQIAIAGATGLDGAWRTGDTVSASWNDGAGGDANPDVVAASIDFSAFGGPAAVAATRVNGVWSASYTITAGALDASGRNVAVTAQDAAGNVTTTQDGSNAVVDNQAPVVIAGAVTLSGASGAGGRFIAGDTVTASWNSSDNADIASVAVDFSDFGGASVAAVRNGAVFSASFTIGAGSLEGGAHHVALTVVDDAGNQTVLAAAGAVGVDNRAPQASSIALVGTPAANASQISYSVVFDEAVNGVDAGDFVLTRGGSALGTIAGVTGSGASYTVTVTGVSGEGTLRLDLKGSGTGIADLAGNAVVGGHLGAVFGASDNAAPQFGGASSFTLAEGKTGVTTVAALDANGDALSYSIQGGPDAALFTIDAASGLLAFRSAPRFTNPLDVGSDNSYQVEVGASDGRGGVDTRLLTIGVLRDLDGDGVADVEDDDIDNDGRPNSIEDAVPGAFGVTGDGNGDGKADSAQLNVASLPTVVPGAPYVTVAVAEGLSLTGVDAGAATGLPRNVRLPLGTLDFTIGGVTPGGTVEVAVFVDRSIGANSYFKQNNSGTWVNVAKAVTVVGDKTKITFDLTDGGAFDSDRSVNGSIVDPGGAAIMTPSIASNGGAEAAQLVVAENRSEVLQFQASAAGAVSWSISGGLDAALFTIDAQGRLSFVGAPDFETPRDQGGDNRYEVQVKVADAAGSATQDIEVRVSDVDESAPPVTPPTGSTVDGVTVQTTTVRNPDGSSNVQLTIPVVQPNRVEQVGNNAVADIPLVKATNGASLLSAQLPNGIGLVASGPGAVKTAASSLTDLIREIQAHTQAGSHDQGQLSGGGTGFLGALAGDTPLLVQTLAPTFASSTAAPATPLVIAGSTDAGSAHTALVIDTRGAPAGAHIVLQDVDFAALIGAVRVSGGAGSQVVWGDGASQHIVLGADDDILHGGGGDDIVGSAGGNDQVFGDEGDDLVFGGEGDDLVDGGSGRDTAMFSGAGRDGYSLRVKDGKLVVTDLHGSDGSDTVVDVEVLRFASSPADTSLRGTVGRVIEAASGAAAGTLAAEQMTEAVREGAALTALTRSLLSTQGLGSLDNAGFVDAMYRNVFERDADAGGKAFWVAALAGGLDRAEVALQFADSAEKLALGQALDLDFNASDVASLVRMYATLFGRQADEGGLNFWIGLHESGQDLGRIADAFVLSAESDARYNQASDADFVAALYQTGLGRQGSAAEQGFWLGHLASGALDRGDVLLGFAESAEQIELVGVISTSIPTL